MKIALGVGKKIINIFAAFGDLGGDDGVGFSGFGGAGLLGLIGHDRGLGVVLLVGVLWIRAGMLLAVLDKALPLRGRGGARARGGGFLLDG